MHLTQSLNENNVLILYVKEDREEGDNVLPPNHSSSKHITIF